MSTLQLSGQSWPTARIDAELLELVPEFLTSCRRQVAEAKQAARAGNLALVRRTGHNFKGSGASYGFGPISALGGELELACKAEDGPEVGRLLETLDLYLAQVQYAAA